MMEVVVTTEAISHAKLQSYCHQLQTTSNFLLLNMHSFICFLFFPGEPGLANFIEAKDDGSGGDN